MTKLTIVTSSPEEANRMAEALANPMNAVDVAASANNTVEVGLNEDSDAALELLAQMVAAQPQYIALGIENPLAAALKSTAGILRNRGAQIDAAVDGNVSAAQRQRPKKDPLILDLNGNGIETVAPNLANPILFDHDADGVKTATGWINPDDGFLVMDRNGDGSINDGTELFGDSTPLYAGGTAADGFAALAQEDTNGDGLVNAADANFAELRIWRDLNQDGESQAGELQTLEEAGINALHVGKTENAQPLANGNLLADLGSYTRTDGTEGGLGAVSGQMGDIDLADNPFYSEFIDTIPLTAEAQSLPDMNGAGLVRDLRQAASLSGELASRVSGLNATLDAPVTRAQMLSEIDGLIDGWAATSGMTTSIAAAQAQGYTLRYLPPGASATDIARLYGGMDSGGGSGGAVEMTSPQELARLEALRQSLAHVEHLIGLLERFNGMTFVDVTSLGVRRGNGQFYVSTGDNLIIDGNIIVNSYSANFGLTMTGVAALVSAANDYNDDLERNAA
ncbi:MAG: hypothetical protein K8H75_01060 [Sulfuricella sp.]|nr:hypothetical protein [Sulfuricella sp.]